MGKKRVFKKWLLFNYTELEALKEYLEEMALEGWILTDINTWLTFKKAEPQKIIYSVELDVKASVFDSFAEVYTVENLEECLNKGWVFTAGFGKLRIYKTKNENALPITKTEKEKYDAIINSTLKLRAIVWFVLPLIFLFNFIMLNLNQNDFPREISYYYANVFYAIFYILVASQIIVFFVWKSRAKKKIELGEKVSFQTLEHLKKKNKIIGIALIIALAVLVLGVIFALFLGQKLAAITLLFMFLIFAIMLFISVWIQRKRFEPATTIGLSIGLGLGVGFIVVVSAVFVVAVMFS